MPDADVYARLFPGRGQHQSVYAQPDWGEVHRELARVGVTLKLLHSEYRDACATAGSPAMGYDRFCKTYQHHVLVAGLASRVGHKAGQSVEYSDDHVGNSVPVLEGLDHRNQRVGFGFRPLEATDLEWEPDPVDQ